MEKIYKIWCGIIGGMGFHDCAVIRFMESRGFTFILGFYSVMYDRISLKPQTQPYNRKTSQPYNPKLYLVELPELLVVGRLELRGRHTRDALELCAEIRNA